MYDLADRYHEATSKCNVMWVGSLVQFREERGAAMAVGRVHRALYDTHQHYCLALLVRVEGRSDGGSGGRGPAQKEGDCEGREVLVGASDCMLVRPREGGVARLMVPMFNYNQEIAVGQRAAVRVEEIMIAGGCGTARVRVLPPGEAPGGCRRWSVLRPEGEAPFTVPASWLVAL